MEALADLMKTVVLFSLLSLFAFGHSRNYTSFVVKGEEVSLDIKLKDLEKEFPDFRAADLEAMRKEIEAYVMKGFQVSTSGGPCTLRSERPPKVDTQHPFGLFGFRMQCPRPDTVLDFQYDLFFDKASDHVGVLIIESPPNPDTITLFSQDQRHFQWKSTVREFEFLKFLREGIWHIWIGTDHILFLVVLLLASLRTQGATTSFRASMSEVLKTVTAFTISHSVTLALAATGVYIPSSRWVETLIAISIIVAAWNNVRPFLPSKPWIIAFLFGFIHGFGFASVLDELVSSRQSLLPIIFGFNLGVEVGQIVIVGVLLPILYLLSRKPYYSRITRWGSILSMLVALLWAIERGFKLQFMPF